MIKILAVCILLMYACPVAAISDTVVFYIAKDGNDQSKGTFLEPFETFEGARDRIRSLKTVALKNKTIVVYVRGGIYYIKKSIELNEADVFTEKHPLIISAFRNEYVELNGGIEIPVRNMLAITEQTVLRKLPRRVWDKVFEVDLKKLNIFDYGRIQSFGFRRPYHPAPMELYVNKKPMIISRWPNDTAALIEKVLDRNGTIQFTQDYPKRWANAKDWWIGGTFCWAWAEDQLPVKFIDTLNKTIQTTEGTMFGFESGTDYRRWYAFNLLEETDAKGEYFIDRQAGKLYFFEDQPKAIEKIEVSMLEAPVISLQGAKNIIFRHFNIENTRGMGVYMERCTNSLFENCTFRNIGIVAVNMGQGIESFKTYQHNGTGKPKSAIIGNLYEHLYDNSSFNRQAGNGNGISKCEIYSAGCGGIILSGGDRSTLTPGRNYVVNCDIHEVNRLGKTLKSCINIDGVGNIIRNNHLHRASQMAVYLHGNNHYVEQNEIDSTCEEAEDMGAIYMGADPSQTGNIFRYNYLHHILPKKKDYRIAGIYLDDGQTDQTVFGNIFYKAGNQSFGAIFIHGGHHILIENNIFIDCITAIGNAPWDQKRWQENISGALLQKRLYESVNIRSPKYVKEYPNLQRSIGEFTNASTAIRNLAYNCTTFCPSYFIQKDNYTATANPGFIFNTKGKLSLRFGSALFNKFPKMKPVKIESAGIQTSVVGNH